MTKKFEITTQIGCALMCTFCPQDKLRRAYTSPIRKLSIDTFRTALAKIPKDFQIVFAGFTEPWSHDDCNTFVREAFEDGRQVSIYTTLYNMDMVKTQELIALIRKHYHLLDQFWIHMPDSHGNMLGWKQTPQYQKILDLMCSSIAKINLMCLDAHGQHHQSLSTQKPVSFWYLHTRADNVDASRIQQQGWHKPPRYEFVVECTRDKNFQSNVMLPNGDLALCCMDYGLKHVIGNIVDQTYEEIMADHTLSRLKDLNNQFGFSTETLCKSCNDALCLTPWNDEQVMHRYKQQHPDFEL